jgi:copper transport protein
VWRIAVVAAAVLIGLLAAPGRAAAHPTLLFTTPAADTAEAVAPQSLVLVFNEPVTVGAGGLVVLDPAGRAIGVDQIAAGREGRAVTGRLSRPLPPGVYTVRWRVTGADGDLVESTFRFAVGAAVTGPGAPGPSGSGGTSWPSAVWRWLLFAGLAVALGGALGARLTCAARAVRSDLPAVRGLQPVGAAAGLVATVGLAVGLAVDADPGALLTAGPGRVVLVEAAAFAAALVLAAVGRRRWAWLPLLAVPAAEGVRAHAQAAAPGWGGLLTGVHLAAAAVWVGALLHVVRAAVVWRSHRAAVWWVVSGYARWAAWLFAAVVATGAVSALILVPISALTSTGYGQLLLAKLVLVALAVGAALVARWGLRRGPDRLPRIARATRVEAGVLAAVLAVTALLVSTPQAGRAPPVVPPPPAGVVLPLATLAGQVGTAVAASDGQLVVRLTTPRVGDYNAPAADQPYRLRASLVPAGSAVRQVRLRGCGEGCFVAPVAWAAGDNVLTLRAEAPGWRGGTASLVLPWPVRPAGERLSRVVAAMTAAGPVTVYEAVTSDTSQPLPEPTPLSMTGKAFVTTEPYSAGVAPQVVQTRSDADGVRLAVGFPADGRYVELVLDARDRIVEETVVDAKHLTRRRFVYREG